MIALLIDGREEYFFEVMVLTTQLTMLPLGLCFFKLGGKLIHFKHVKFKNDWWQS